MPWASVGIVLAQQQSYTFPISLHTIAAVYYGRETIPITATTTTTATTAVDKPSSYTRAQYIIARNGPLGQFGDEVNEAVLTQAIQNHPEVAEVLAQQIQQRQQLLEQSVAKLSIFGTFVVFAPVLFGYFELFMLMGLTTVVALYFIVKFVVWRARFKHVIRKLTKLHEGLVHAQAIPKPDTYEWDFLCQLLVLQQIFTLSEE